MFVKGKGTATDGVALDVELGRERRKRNTGGLRLVADGISNSLAGRDALMLGDVCASDFPRHFGEKRV